MNICIVDDDKYVVDKIVEGIDWKRWGIEGICVAYNIKQAKDILNTLQIDILLSDIEMPQGSGLELLEWVREKKLPVECIYLSSYAYFAYAQKALELHSRGYLLKPVSNKELSSVLEKLVDEIRLAKGQTGEDRQREKEKFWSGILFGENCKAEGYYEKDRVILSLLRVFRGIEHKKVPEDAVLYLTLKHMAEEFWRERGFPLDMMVRYSDDCTLLVMKNCKKKKEDFRQILGEFLQYLEDGLHMSACIYVGKQSGIAECREQLVSLFQMIREGVPGENGILFLEEWVGEDAVYTPPDFSLWEHKMICSQDMDGVSMEITGYVEELCKSGEVNVGVLGRFKADLQQMVFHYMMENGIAMNQIFEAGEFDYYCDKASWTLRDMKEFISIFFRKLKAAIKAEDTDENVVEQIMHYIDDNLGGDLSRAKLASQVFISEDYLSKKFAAYTGLSIPNYVAVKRMEKARDYFRNTSYSVSQVAMRVGYTNFSYFSKTFRDYAGCTPNEYRSKHGRS